MYGHQCLRLACFTPGLDWSTFQSDDEEATEPSHVRLCCLGILPSQGRGAGGPPEAQALPPVKLPRQPWTATSQCPAGHPLQPNALAPQGSRCNGCGRLAQSGEQVVGCRPCSVYLCRSCRPHAHVRSTAIERMLHELFRLHDLNANGFLEEEELVQLNTKVAMLHHGKDVDRSAVKSKYRALFREKLDPQGRPVPYPIFRRYVVEVLDALDPDPLAQEMALEQFAAEAESARAVFNAPSFASVTDMVIQAQRSVDGSTGACATTGGP